MDIIVSFVLLVFGILQVILFFKIWGMTSDVSDILRIMESKADKANEIDNYDDKVRYLSGNGRQEDAEEVLGEMTDKLMADITSKRITTSEAKKRYAILEKKYEDSGLVPPQLLKKLVE